MTLPIGLSDPVWLWLAVPAVAIVVVGWMGASRTLPIGRRVASLVIRLVLVACLVLSLAGARLALLAVEWLLFHRPTRRSLARAFRGRPAPLSGRAR